MNHTQKFWALVGSLTVKGVFFCISRFAIWNFLCLSFTKLLRPLVKHWRAKEFSIVVYLDDGWGTESSLSCTYIAESVYSDLVNAGFVVNQDKSIWTPCSVLE